MKEITCAVLAVLLAAPVVGAQAIEAPNEWDAAILEIEDKRCIGKLCLGMTLAEAEALFGPALAGTDQVLGLACKGSAATGLRTTFVDHDRNKYHMSFLLFPGNEATTERYRASGVSVTIDHGRVIKQIMFDGLVRQWDLSPSGEPQSRNAIKWFRTDRWSVTELHEVGIDGTDAALLIARLAFPRHATWVEEGHVCQLEGQKPQQGDAA